MKKMYFLKDRKEAVIDRLTYMSKHRQEYLQDKEHGMITLQFKQGMPVIRFSSGRVTSYWDFSFDGSDIFVCLYYVIVIFIAGACVLTENANIRQLRKKQMLQYDVVLVQKQPVIETESYGAENIRDTKRFYPILGRDVHSGYESTCFLLEEDYKKREIGDTITMTRFIWK